MRRAGASWPAQPLRVCSKTCKAWLSSLSWLRAAPILRTACSTVVRDPWDEQVYGVPALWLFDRRGQVVSPPFRGSRYFNGGDIQLPYALSDVDAAIASALAQDRRASKSHAARVGSPHHGRLRDRRPAKVLGVSLNLALWGSGDCQFRVSSSRGHALV